MSIQKWSTGKLRLSWVSRFDLHICAPSALGKSLGEGKQRPSLARVGGIYQTISITPARVLYQRWSNWANTQLENTDVTVTVPCPVDVEIQTDELPLDKEIATNIVINEPEPEDNEAPKKKTATNVNNYHSIVEYVNAMATASIFYVLLFTFYFLLFYFSTFLLFYISTLRLSDYPIFGLF